MPTSSGPSTRWSRSHSKSPSTKARACTASAPLPPRLPEPQLRGVIVNPASGGGRTRDRWHRIVHALETGVGGAPVEVVLTRRAGHATELARAMVSDGVRDIVVLGGDGTIGEVVAGLVRTDGSGMVDATVRVAIIHQGTGGDLVRGLDIPTDTTAAVDVALNGVPRIIDVGVARYSVAGSDQRVVRGFVTCANVGMAHEVVTRVTGRLKRLGRRGAFTVATLACLAHNHPRWAHVTTDEGIDEDVALTDIILSNNRFMGGGMLVAPDALLDDGLFDLVMIGAARRSHLMRVFPRIYAGGHVRDHAVRIERTRHVEIATVPGRAPEGVVLDGEPLGQTPASFTMIPAALQVLVPASPARV
ncbi:MAG: diacylglycerol kinase family lipid kinase [Thermoleophilia bacterium]|nr:diacylglycerol kinase family lipid kinase [Thermoleophilia bacterium]